LAVSHAVPAGSREVTVAYNFISERTVIKWVNNWFYTAKKEKLRRKSLYEAAMRESLSYICPEEYNDQRIVTIILFNARKRQTRSNTGMDDDDST
jgi:hypothetical protein